MSRRTSPDSVQLFTGGTIRTVDAPEVVDAVLVVGDRIVATGARAACEAAAPTTPEMVDLDGATMLPGFVDAVTAVAGRKIHAAIFSLSGLNRLRRPSGSHRRVVVPGAP